MKKEIGKISCCFPQELYVRGEYDVVIAGAGIAGCAAALAAARNGMKVCLIEKEYMAGGLATSGLVWCYLPICDGNGNKISGGIAEEFLLLSAEDGPYRIPECWLAEGDIEARKKQRYEVEFNPLSFVSRLENLLTSCGVELRYGSQICSIIRTGSTVDAVVVAEKEGLGAIKCKCIIDATGDADVCFLTGEDVVTRSDNRLAYWSYSTDGQNLKRQETQTPLYGKLPDGERLYSGVITEDITDFCLESRRRLEKVFCDTKNGIPVMMSSIPQFRMSRRLSGRYSLRLSDEGQWFDDCVGMIVDWRYRGSVFSVPYRMLLPKKTSNLIVAGRCVSAQSDVGDPVRSIPACAVFGEAAGTAAALAISSNTDILSLPVEILQRKLEESNVLINRKLLSKRDQDICQ